VPMPFGRIEVFEIRLGRLARAALVHDLADVRPDKIVPIPDLLGIPFAYSDVFFSLPGRARPP
jgi:ABC-type amino acid transport system permease subunit